MIEIDDAGGGCFIGPEILVIHRLETGDIRYLDIPPQVRERVLYATKILRKVFRDLVISKTETIKLCRGEIFDLFQACLEDDGYRVSREKVSAATDRLAEERFLEILYSYGFPRDVKLEGRNYQEFYEQVSLWYYCLPRQAAEKLRKIRLRPPLRPKIIARKYPNLLRLMFTEEIAG